MVILPKQYKMLTRTTALLAFLLCSQIVFSQKTYTINGLLQDEDENSLVAATVVLLNTADSSFADYGLSADNGKFKLTGVRDKNYQLQISYVGYGAFIQDITLDKDYDLGTIVMKEATNMLATAQIEAEHIPIRMNGDTLEFNSAAFNVQTHDDVEGLLEQMPGVEIDEDGTVKINGKKVEKILVDGKEFFGADVKAALKNLPADAIKKIEVYDKKSDKEELTGKDDEEESKTINLTLKEDKKVGYMGNIEGGYGYYLDKHYYKGKLGLNYFNPKMRISIIGASNNVNKAGFSYQDMQGMTGGSDNFMSGYSGMSIGNNWNDPILSLLWGNASGETRAITGGINMNLFLSDKTELSAHYMYTNANKYMLTKSFRRSLTPENFYTRNSENTQLLLAQRHVFNTKFTHKFDSTQEIRFRLKMKYTGSNKDNSRFTKTLGDQDSLENDINQNSERNEAGFGLITSVHYQKKLAKKGRSLWANVAFAFADNENVFQTFSRTNIYQNEQISLTDTLDQNQSFVNNKQVYGAEFAYTEPLGEKNDLEFKLRAGFSTESNDRKAFDIREQIQILNKGLTDLYQKQYDFQAFTSNFKHQGEKVSVDISVGLQRSGLKGVLVSNATTINQTYYYPVGKTSFSYKFSKTKTFRVSYRTKVREPNLDQLQPMPNNQNPLSIRLGNPNLIPEYLHNMWISYNLWDQLNFTSFYISIYGNLVQNAIVNKQTIDADYRTVYEPINFGTSLNSGLYLGYNGEIKKVVKFTIRGGANLSQGQAIINDNVSGQLNHIYNIYMSLGNKKKEIVDISVSARADLRNSIFSQNDALNVTSLSHSYKVNARVTIAKKWNLKTAFKYDVFDGLGYGENFAIPIWSASVSRTFFKSDQLKIELSVENILNEAIRVNRYNWGGNVTETKTNLLGRYFMLSIAYKINKMGGNKPEGE